MKFLVHDEYKRRLTVGVLVVIIIIFMFALYSVIREMRAEEKQEVPQAEQEEGLMTCEDLGCPAGSQFVGSKGSNVYHTCDSRWALAILPENRICFYNTEEAESKGYRAAAE